MHQQIATLTIGEFAASAHVGVETVRFYQRKGLLPEPTRREGAIRRYAAADVQRLRFIRSAQRLGFSLAEVSELLKLEDGAHCRQASSIAEAKLTDIRTRLADLSRMEAALSELVRECRLARGKVSCPLIEAFHAAA